MRNEGGDKCPAANFLICNWYAKVAGIGVGHHYRMCLKYTSSAGFNKKLAFLE